MIEIFENQFHGGKKIAAARSISGAIRRVIREEGKKGCSGGDCECGGLTIREDGNPVKWQENGRGGFDFFVEGAA